MPPPILGNVSAHPATYAGLSAVRRSLCLLVTVGCLMWNTAFPACYGRFGMSREDPVAAEKAHGEEAMAKVRLFAPMRKAVIGYWSGTRVC